MKNNEHTISLFNDSQISQQALKQIEFLRLIYPFLSSDTYNVECIELRPIRRTEGNDFLRSLNLWRLDDKGVKEHKKFLKSINGQAVCVYYSAFTFDYDKECCKDDGSRYIKGTVNNQNSIYAQILAMDFDDISLEEHEKEMEIINKQLGIQTISIFTGHGFQEIILLEEKVYDKDILSKFTNLLLSKGFSVDSKIVDSARVLRMPFTFNCKEFDKNSSCYSLAPMAIPTKILKNTKKRYPVRLVFQKLLQLPTVRPAHEQYKNIDALFSPTIDLNDTPNVFTPKDGQIAPKTLLADSVRLMSIKDAYSMIDFEILPDAVKNMLVETPEGLRNSAMLFLIPFFRNHYGLSLPTIIDILKVWGMRCKPSLDPAFVESEVKRLYSYDIKGKGAYTSELAKEFGFIEFDSYKIDNKVLIPNDFINSYHLLNDCSVRTYLMIKLYEKIEDIYEWTDDDIQRAAKISRRTWFRIKDDLLKYGFLYKKVSNKKDGNKYFYFISKIYDKSQGFTLFNVVTLENMVYNSKRELNNGEIKLYTLLYSMVSNNTTETCWASQSYLADKIGKKRNSLVALTDGLHNKRYIKKDSYKDDQGIPHCIYTLVY